MIGVSAPNAEPRVGITVPVTDDTVGTMPESVLIKPLVLNTGPKMLTTGPSVINVGPVMELTVGIAPESVVINPLVVSTGPIMPTTGPSEVTVVPRVELKVGTSDVPNPFNSPALDPSDPSDPRLVSEVRLLNEPSGSAESDNDGVAAIEGCEASADAASAIPSASFFMRISFSRI